MHSDYISTTHPSLRTATMPRAHERCIVILKYPVEQTFYKTSAIIYCNIYTEVGLTRNHHWQWFEGSR